MKTRFRIGKENKYRIIRVLLTSIILLCLQGSFLYATDFPKLEDDEDILIFIDGKKIESDEAKPFIADGRTMVPVRFLSQALGARVNWLDDEKIVAINKDDKMLYIPVDSKKYLFDNSLGDMDVAAKIVNSRVYLPIKFIAEALDYELEWLAYDQAHSFIFLYSNDKSIIEKKAIKEKLIREYDFAKQDIIVNEINTIRLLNTVRAAAKGIKQIYTIEEKGFSRKYSVTDLVDNSVEFLYACNNLGQVAFTEYLKQTTDQTRINDLFDNYQNYIGQFLKNNKIVFKNYEKVLDASDYFKVYLSALDLSSNRSYILCFNYGQSQVYDNKLTIQKIEIAPLEEKESFMKNSVDQHIKKKADKKQEKIEKHYSTKQISTSRRWDVDDSKQLTRTSFYIQKMDDGTYQKEFPSLHYEYDDWLNKDSKKKYKQLSSKLAKKILNTSKLSPDEIDEYFNSGFRINAYAEIKAIDPNDNRAKWYRLTENLKDYTPYRNIFRDDEVCTFTALTKQVIKNFPSYKISACKPFEFKGDKNQKKIINIEFLDIATEQKIKRDQKIIDYSSSKKYIYKPEKVIGKYYKIVDDQDITVKFDSKDKVIEKGVVVYYQVKDTAFDTADIILDEWRLSKKFDNIVHNNNYQDAELGFIIPQQAEDRSLRSFGMMSPLQEWTYYLEAKQENDFLKVDYNKQFSKDICLSDKTIYQTCDGPLLAKKPGINTGKIPPYFEAIGNVNFSLGTDTKYYYRPVKKELKHSFSDNTEEYHVALAKKIPLEYQSKPAIYNLAFKYLAHQSLPRIAPKFNGFAFNDPSSNEFGMTISSDRVLSVLPQVMMIYDTDDGETKAKFVSANQLRTIHPLSNHRVSFNLANNISVKSNVSNPKKASSLAKAMGNQAMPVVDKGAMVNLNYAAKNILTVSSFSLALATDTSNLNPNHEVYLGSLGVSDNKINANLGIYFDNINDIQYSPVSLLKNNEQKIIRHSLEVRSGRVVAMDGVGYSLLSPRMKNVLDNMKLTSPVPSDNVLGAFAQNEGAAVTEQEFCDLSSQYRHFPQQLGNGWYNEDSLDLVLIEKQVNFDLANSEFNIKAPLNVKGLETPINDRMKYSRGKKIDINMAISLDNTDSAVYQTIEAAFIIPNSER